LTQTSEILAQAVGRRKSAIAQISINSGDGKFFINGKGGLEYLQENPSFLLSIQAPFELFGLQNSFNVNVNVTGGGLSSQAEAIRLAIARALCLIQQSYRPHLKIKGYLTRDSRCKERRKYGLKKARKAPQFSKR